MLNTSSIPRTPLSATGLVALADLTVIPYRTALTGTASFFDVLLLAPGIHKQQTASEVNGGELPTTGAMTTGYVFRVENQATSSYFQRIGKPGHLVTASVALCTKPTGVTRILRLPNHDGGVIPMILYLLPIAATITTIVILGTIQDYWGLSVMLMLILARFINVVVIKRRSKLGWKGC